jgi:hypothetical protein
VKEWRILPREVPEYWRRRINLEPFVRGRRDRIKWRWQMEVNSCSIDFMFEMGPHKFRSSKTIEQNSSGAILSKHALEKLLGLFTKADNEGILICNHSFVFAMHRI